MKRNYKNILSVFILLLVMASCAPTKRASYFRMNEEISALNEPDQVYQRIKDSTYIIKPGDELYITVSTADNADNNFSSNQIGFTEIDLLSYLVDKEGFVKIPYVEKMKVAGLTLDGASNIMESELSQYLYQPVVTMKLVNARITVLGEVNSPGVFTLNNKAINIYQAIGYAGDISEFGNRKKVLVVREENNIITKKYIDLTNDQVMASRWYIIQPNDVIYVEPMVRKSFGVETFPWTLISSVISTTILIMTFMITLNS